MNRMSLRYELALKFRLATLSAFCGCLAGIAAAIFLFLLNEVTKFRQGHSWIIWGLPAAGFVIGWVYQLYGQEVVKGHNLILDEIHDPKNIVPFRMAPLVLGGTLLTHLFGGSAGREGTVVQMGASLTDQVTRFFKLNAEERKTLLIAGTGAGFAAAIGAPWAGTFFGMEVVEAGRVRWVTFFESLIASFAGYFTVLALKAPHSHFTKIEIQNESMSLFLYLVVAGILFGLAAHLFLWLTHGIESLMNFISFSPLKTFIGGVILLLGFSMEGSDRYMGLGLESILKAFHQASAPLEPFMKMGFTAITVGSGFKGGEFVPLVFIGTTLGSALSIFTPEWTPLFASLGFAAVFGAAANTPLACAIMATELFGLQVAPYALLCCFISFSCSGNSGLYRSQKKEYKKNIWRCFSKKS